MATLDMINVQKAFGPVKVLHDISIGMADTTRTRGLQSTLGAAVSVTPAWATVATATTLMSARAAAMTRRAGLVMLGMDGYSPLRPAIPPGRPI